MNAMNTRLGSQAASRGTISIFSKYSGTEVKTDDQDYVILREDEILGVFTTTAKAKSTGR